MILDPSAFDAEPQPAIRYDADGLPVPPLWHRLEVWAALPLSFRQRKAQEYRAELARELKPNRQHRPTQKRFSTDYAIQWGRAQGWTLIDRERYDYRTKRHHDLEGAVDAIFDNGVDGRVGIQGAGRNERATHYQRFMDWGGPEKAKRRNLTIYYLEFVRGNKTPEVIEQWA